MGSDPLFTKSENHYSYTAYADPAMAATFDARRFGGPIGQMLVDDQERVVLGFLGNVSGRDVLDAGTGTGRAAVALASRGARVTAIDASNEMLNVARQRAAALGLAVEFSEGDVHRLAYPDRTFDAVVCLRVLMHAPDWRKALFELCRVSRQRVVFDYPAATSAALAQAVWRRSTSAFVSNVEAYRVFRPARIARELHRHGFRVVSAHKQFVLPIALHKLIGSPRFTRAIEHPLAAIGLLRVAGSPVTISAERCAS
jgi:ubiquinone/menaquinone biosynthesis C-methylase UbiE